MRTKVYKAAAFVAAVLLGLAVSMVIAGGIQAARGGDYLCPRHRAEKEQQAVPQMEIAVPAGEVSEKCEDVAGLPWGTLDPEIPGCTVLLEAPDGTMLMLHIYAIPEVEV